MKTIIINGSPRENGNCAQLAEKFAVELASNGIESEILQIGSMDIKGCKSCWACNDTGKCVQEDEEFFGACEKIYQAEGVMIFAPVYYDSMPGPLKSFLDRMALQERKGGRLRGKIGGACAVLRRTGGVSTLDDIYHCLMCTGFIMAPTEGECMVFGFEPGEVEQDQEGLDILDNLAANMAWLMKVTDRAEEELPMPEMKKRASTNFVR